MKWLRSAVPATAFFLLLAAAAAAGYWFGRSRAGAAGTETATVYTCSMHRQVRQDRPGLCPICQMELVPLTALGDDDEPGVRIDPVVVQNMGVRVARIGHGPLHRTLRAFGTLREAEPLQRDIALKVGGFVERLFADTEGMQIEIGDPLFELYAAELVVAQEELIAAKRSGDPTLLEAARSKLQLWDLPEPLVDELQDAASARRTITWRSPVQGTLMRRDVVAGAPAEANRVLLRIVDLTRLWLDAQVPEHELADVTLGQSARATMPARPGFSVDGRVVFVGPAIDPIARTAIVRVELDNADGTLKPGMFARLELAATLADHALLAPAEAVIDTGVRRIAWLAVGQGRFEMRELQLGRRGDGGVVEVLAGLSAGDPVVVSGQFLIDAESRLREASRKLSDDGLMAGGEPPPPPAVSTSPQTAAALDALLIAYVSVQRDLAADRHDPPAWRTLAEAGTALTAAAEPEVQHAAHALASALAEAPADLTAARVQFKTVSAAAIALFERARPRDASADALFVHHCPMAEAEWLQLDDAVRNPYYGSSMLDCGSVRRTLPLSGAERGR